MSSSKYENLFNLNDSIESILQRATSLLERTETTLENLSTNQTNENTMENDSDTSTDTEADGEDMLSMIENAESLLSRSLSNYSSASSDNRSTTTNNSTSSDDRSTNTASTSTTSDVTESIDTSINTSNSFHTADEDSTDDENENAPSSGRSSSSTTVTNSSVNSSTTEIYNLHDGAEVTPVSPDETAATPGQPTSSGSIMLIPDEETPVSPTQRRRQRDGNANAPNLINLDDTNDDDCIFTGQSHAHDNAPVIDLCSSNYIEPIPVPNRVSSDDVIVINDSQYEIPMPDVEVTVSLRTPGSIRRGQNSRSRSQQDNEIEEIIPTLPQVQQVQVNMASPPKRAATSTDNILLNASQNEPPDKRCLKCPICLESVFDKKPTSTTCGHVFCYSCITRAIQLTKQCPMCKKKLKNNNIHDLFFSTDVWDTKYFLFSSFFMNWIKMN
uniref:Putative ring finger n=1 Tax=Corethrella appendiculata TaxID=1370023 RepID=U5ENW4_9DIPT